MAVPSPAVIQALMVTAELTGTVLTKAAARVFASDLAAYPESQVLPALDRCRREVRSRLTVADVVSRLADGRPTPDEAWALCPQDERQSVVWTEEVAQAWGVASEAPDRVSARLAFLACYRRIVQENRDRGSPPRWFPSLGTDPAARTEALERARELGRLGPSVCAALEVPGAEMRGELPEPVQSTLRALTHRAP